MSQSNPNPEERKRIVDSAVGNLQKKYTPTQPDDVDLLMQKVQQMVITVNTMWRPVYSAAADLTSSHPLYIHSVKGRNALKASLTKLFCDQFVQLDRDELIFMLALVHAQQCLEKQL